MRAFGILLLKELRTEMRGREMLGAGLLLALLVLLVGQLAWGRVPDPAASAPGVLWIAILFAALVALGRNLHRERDQGTWEALALLPVDRGTIYLAKVTALFLVLLLIETITIPLFALVFSDGLVAPLPELTPVLLLGSLGLSAAGTLLAGLSAPARYREVLLPILLLPLIVPLLMVALQATERVLRDTPISLLAAEYQFLLAFDAIFLAVGWIAFDHVLGE